MEANAEQIPSDESENSSTSDGDSSDSSVESSTLVDDRKVLKIKLRAKIRQRAQARERGATPAFKKRDVNFVKCGMVKEWLVDTGCGYDLVSKRETGLIKRFVSKAKVPITFHTANTDQRGLITSRTFTSVNLMRTSHHTFSKTHLRF
jgi:hypothetical protein